MKRRPPSAMPGRATRDPWQCVSTESPATGQAERRGRRHSTTHRRRYPHSSGSAVSKMSTRHHSLGTASPRHPGSEAELCRGTGPAWHCFGRVTTAPASTHFAALRPTVLRSQPCHDQTLTRSNIAERHCLRGNAINGRPHWMSTTTDSGVTDDRHRQGNQVHPL